MAKHKCPEPPPDTGRWMGTYGDMVTLLMAFFVMLFAVSETSNQKFEAFVAGLAGPFDNPATELGLIGGDALSEASTSPIALIAPMAAGETTDANDEAEAEFDTSGLSASELAELQAEIAQQQQLDEIRGELGEAMQGAEIPISADLRDDERGLVVAISTDDVLFRSGQAELSDAGREILGVLAPVLVDAPNTIVIEGHTDDRPLSAGGYTNWNLSTDRAVAVVQLLIDDHGLSFDRVSAAGYADNRPLVPNDSDANRSTNRRVEILIVGLALERLELPELPPAGTETFDNPVQAAAAEPPVEVTEDPVADEIDPRLAEIVGF